MLAYQQRLQHNSRGAKAGQEMAISEQKRPEYIQQ